MDPASAVKCEVNLDQARVVLRLSAWRNANPECRSSGQILAIPPGYASPANLEVDNILGHYVYYPGILSKHYGRPFRQSRRRPECLSEAPRHASHS